MIEVQSVDAAIKDAYKILVRDSKWDINCDTLYSDYFTYVKGENIIQSIGWSWINLEEKFTRCIKVMYGEITDYYHSYENHTIVNIGDIYSQQVDPDTEVSICKYHLTTDGVHKYVDEINSEVVVKNSYAEEDLTLESVAGDTPLMQYKEDFLLVSRKPYGDMVYFCLRNFPYKDVI